MDWSNAKNYTFTSVLDREGWAWEFLRRNNEYKADFKAATCSKEPVYDPPKLSNESDRQWIARAVEADKEPRKLNPLTGLGEKWGLEQLQDPADDSAPSFLQAYPFLPNWRDLDSLYDRDAHESPIRMRPDIAVIAFDTARPLSKQLERAKDLFFSRQEVVTGRRKNWKPDNWALYLRLLDAKNAGAETAEIIAAIDKYSILPNDAASGYLADDRVSDDLKQARRLCAEPTSILH